MGILSEVGDFITGTGEFLFPTDTKVTGGGTSSTESKATTATDQTSRGTKQLEIDQVALQKIIEDVLGGPQGLASIFGGEKSAGLYNSSAAAQASGDIATKLVGELAKLTAKEVTSGKQAGTQMVSGIQDVSSTTQQTQDKEGVFEKVGKIFGF